MARASLCCIIMTSRDDFGHIARQVICQSVVLAPHWPMANLTTLELNIALPIHHRCLSGAPVVNEAGQSPCPCRCNDVVQNCPVLRPLQYSIYVRHRQYTVTYVHCCACTRFQMCGSQGCTAQVHDAIMHAGRVPDRKQRVRQNAVSQTSP